MKKFEIRHTDGTTQVIKAMSEDMARRLREEIEHERYNVEKTAQEGAKQIKELRSRIEALVRALETMTRADLAGADLARANLVGANLAGADLARANLAGADLAGADLARANLVGADLARANLAGADLAGANLARANLIGAYLARANLVGAYLARANLVGADLARADLAGANLAGADLAGANLAGADLADQWVIQGAHRSDGYPFFLQKLTDDSEPMVKAGCRHFTLAQAQAHWEETRAGTALFKETENIVRSMVELARIRKLMP